MPNPLDNIETLLRAMHDRGAEINALQDLVTQVNTGLADVVALLEADAKPEDPAEDAAEAKMKAEAMAGALSAAGDVVASEVAEVVYPGRGAAARKELPDEDRAMQALVEQQEAEARDLREVQEIIAALFAFEGVF